MNVSIAVGSAPGRILRRGALAVCLPAAAFLAAASAGDGSGARAGPPALPDRSIKLSRPRVEVPSLAHFGPLPELRVPLAPGAPPFVAPVVPDPPPVQPPAGPPPPADPPPPPADPPPPPADPPPPPATEDPPEDNGLVEDTPAADDPEVPEADLPPSELPPPSETPAPSGARFKRARP